MAIKGTKKAIKVSLIYLLTHGLVLFTPFSTQRPPSLRSLQPSYAVSLPLSLSHLDLSLSPRMDPQRGVAICNNSFICYLGQVTLPILHCLGSFFCGYLSIVLVITCEVRATANWPTKESFRHADWTATLHETNLLVGARPWVRTWVLFAHSYARVSCTTCCVLNLKRLWEQSLVGAHTWSI